MAVVLLLTAFKISGSSIGVYHDFFYGPTHDSNLLINKPRTIRSDEWLVNTEMTIAQSNDNYQTVNKNIGRGEDMSVSLDVPNKDWSELFRPHNWAFFVLPFENAFAFKWWVIGALLVISAYFFILALLPGRRLLAALLSLSLLASAFTQWWYQFVTLGSLYYPLFIAALFIYLLKQKSLLRQLLVAGVITYLLICYVLVLYPPFQIATGLALAAFCVGYLVQHWLEQTKADRPQFYRKMGMLLVSVIITGLVTALFIHTRAAAVHAIQNTVYPGKRVIASGGFDPIHFFSGNLDFQLQFTGKALHYQLISQGISNQSEAANFVYLLPFLLLPAIYLMIKSARQRGRFSWRRLDWPLATVSLLFVALLVRLFVPHFNTLFKLFLLDKVPQKRLVIGLGLLNLMLVVLFMRRLQAHKKQVFSGKIALLLALVVFAVELFTGLVTRHRFPEFIGNARVLLFSIPVPVIFYLLLRKKFELAAAGLLAFGVFMSIGVHPLYRNVSAINQTDLSKEIQQLNKQQPGRWATESLYLENFAILNGAPSVSGLYTYPQFGIWRPIDNGQQQDLYNRYAHVEFNFDRDPNINTGTQLKLIGADHFQVISEPCSGFMKDNNVRYILTSQPINDNCLKLVNQYNYPSRTFYIYQLQY